jgi:hypothetical protein
MTHFNRLKAAEHERLSLLLGECAEAIAIVGKILRHGYESTNPTLPLDEQRTNRSLLTQEIGDVLHAIDRLTSSCDLDADAINNARANKRDSVVRWMHHDRRAL